MEEMSVLELQEKLASGELTALGLLESYLERIEQIDRHGPALNAVIELNPDALGSPKRSTGSARPAVSAAAAWDSHPDQGQYRYP